MLPMMVRFSLYGFLKNQRYFEPFLLLAFLEKGLGFAQIGLLIGVREITTVVLEVPSGAVADVCGRRRSMIFSFLAYIAGFALLGAAAGMTGLLAGMLLHGVGDAFRSGTHKAMIFAWLRSQGREGERVRVYGYTRSWSKFGSAVSVLIAAPIVLFSNRYEWVFFAAIPPCVINVINFLGYPRSLDEQSEKGGSVGAVLRHTVHSIKTAFRGPGLRRLYGESMGFDGVFAASKDYLQPVLEASALSLAVGWAWAERWSDAQLGAVLIGPVYAVLYLLSGAASRRSHRVSEAAGGEEGAARWLWVGSAIVFATLAAAGFSGSLAALAIGFVALHVLHNLWRPILISRFDSHGADRHGASLLSIESQAHRVATTICAPLLGAAVDALAAQGSPHPWWPVGALGFSVAVIAIVLWRPGEQPGRR